MFMWQFVKELSSLESVPDIAPSRSLQLLLFFSRKSIFKQFVKLFSCVRYMICGVEVIVQSTRAN